MRLGMTVPFGGFELGQQRELFESLAAANYTDLWTAESDGGDGLSPLVLASQWTPTMRLGTAILPAYTRGPALLAQSVSSLAEVAPGRAVIGIGSSSNVIVQNWNGIPFEHPYARVRDTVRFLRSALSGEKVDHAYETFTIKGFKLGRVPQTQPKIMIAALREQMLKLAGRESDGVIINWLSADDVVKVNGIVQAASPDGSAKEVVARIFVCPSEDLDAVRASARFAIAAYMNVGVYKAFHQWLGNGDAFAGMWDAWAAGDRKAALAAISDELVDRLIIHGSMADCRAKIGRYRDNGVTTPVVALLPFAKFDLPGAIAGLAGA